MLEDKFSRRQPQSQLQFDRKRSPRRAMELRQKGQVHTSSGVRHLAILAHWSAKSTQKSTTSVVGQPASWRRAQRRMVLSAATSNVIAKSAATAFPLLPLNVVERRLTGGTWARRPVIRSRAACLFDRLELSKRAYAPILMMMARHCLAPFTWTECLRMFEPVGIDRWGHELGLKYGMRDGLTRPVGSRMGRSLLVAQECSRTRRRRSCVPCFSWLQISRLFDWNGSSVPIPEGS